MFLSNINTHTNPRYRFSAVVPSSASRPHSVVPFSISPCVQLAYSFYIVFIIIFCILFYTHRSTIYLLYVHIHLYLPTHTVETHPAPRAQQDKTTSYRPGIACILYLFKKKKNYHSRAVFGYSERANAKNPRGRRPSETLNALRLPHLYMRLRNVPETILCVCRPRLT